MVKAVSHTVKRPGRKHGAADIEIPVAEDLTTVPGIPQKPVDVAFYSREYPLESQNIEKGADREWVWTVYTEEVAKYRKGHNERTTPLIDAAAVSGDLEPTAAPSGASGLTEAIRGKARELGFGEVGFTKFDRKYAYVSKKHWVKYEHAICIALEQDYAQTQTIPSLEAELAHFGTYEEEGATSLELADYIRTLGYHAQVHSPSDPSAAYIPMFVSAGLGQLGACGYLLTPHEGNRCRLILLTTGANVTYDEPVDYGIHAFCQVCQVCVNRCPGRALMRDKVWWRGIEKHKLYFKRCRPVMARYLGCGICMKVCPIQKYGMATVMTHYAETGQVLGKGTHDLEGYEIEGKGYFGPGELPVFEREFFNSMPTGDTENWAFENLKKQATEAGGAVSDEMLAEFKQTLEVGMGQSRDNLAMMEMEDYI